MPLPNPVIVVPGITGSELRDEYAVSPETVWSAVFRKQYERLVLHPDDFARAAREPELPVYELHEPARVVSDTVFRLAYGPIVEELRHNLTEKADEPVPVYPFAYDWRQPLDIVEARLGAFVREVISRTSLMPHYHRDRWADEPRVNLVGHSMGGLIIAGYLHRLGKKAPVGKVATLGTPFRGSLEAPIKVITGTASLGSDMAPASREREAARLTPALYHLLPTFSGALETEPGLPDDLYHVATWQDGVIETLAEFIRLHGLRRGSKTERMKWARDLLADMLTVARRHRERVEEFRLSRVGLPREAWLCVVGVDAVTRVRLLVERVNGKALFNLRGSDRENRWEEPDPELKTATGDGTVPYRGAEPGFVPRESLVCVRPGDFGYWEIADRALLKIAGFHAMLPNLNLVHRLLVSHFRGRVTKGAWGRAAPGVSREEWNPPIRDLEYKE